MVTNVSPWLGAQGRPRIRSPGAPIYGEEEADSFQLYSRSLLVTYLVYVVSFSLSILSIAIVKDTRSPLPEQAASGNKGMTGLQDGDLALQRMYARSLTSWFRGETPHGDGETESL